MAAWIEATIFLFTAAATIRALYIVSSFGAGGESSLDKPSLVIRYPQLPNISLVLLALAFLCTSYVGFKFFGWLGALTTPIATVVVGCPLIALALRQRDTKASIYYYSNPFTQLVALLPLFLVLTILFPTV